MIQLAHVIYSIVYEAYCMTTSDDLNVNLHDKKHIIYMY